MRKRNGFTLVELLVTISMLAVVGTIIIYNVVSLNNDTKDLQYDRMVENIKNAAKTYVSLYPEDFSDLYSSKAFQYMKIQQLIDEGLLDEETTNPYTNELISGDDRIRAYVDGTSYEMVFDYPVTSESNLMYITAYDIVSGTVSGSDSFTPIYVYDGLSTNAFSMVNEDGTLDTDYVAAGYSSLIDYYTSSSSYNLTYTVPNSFKQCTQALCGESVLGVTLSDEELKNYYLPPSAGSYEITFKWVDPDDKVNRNYKRKVRVTDSRTSSLENLQTQTTTSSTTVTIPSSTEFGNAVVNISSREFYGSTDTAIQTGVKLGTGNWKIEMVAIPKNGATDIRTLFSTYDDNNGVEVRMNYATGSSMRVIGGTSASGGWAWISDNVNPKIGTDRIKVEVWHYESTPNILYYCIQDLDTTSAKVYNNKITVYVNTNQSRALVVGASQDINGNLRYPFIGTIESFVLYKEE